MGSARACERKRAFGRRCVDANFSARVFSVLTWQLGHYSLPRVHSHAERTRTFWAFNMIRAMLSVTLIFAVSARESSPLEASTTPDTAAVPLHDIQTSPADIQMSRPDLPGPPRSLPRPSLPSMRRPRPPLRSPPRSPVSAPGPSPTIRPAPTPEPSPTSAATIPSAEGTRSTSGSSPGAGPRASAGPPRGCAVSRSAT